MSALSTNKSDEMMVRVLREGIGYCDNLLPKGQMVKDSMKGFLIQDRLMSQTNQGFVVE